MPMSKVPMMVCIFYAKITYVVEMIPFGKQINYFSYRTNYWW